MLRKERREHYDIFAPYEGCKTPKGSYKYKREIHLENNTSLYVAPIRVLISGLLQNVVPVAKTLIKPGQLRAECAIIGYNFGHRMFKDANEVQCVLDLLEGRKKINSFNIESELQLIHPRRGSKSYPQSDVIETTDKFYIVKGGRALAKSKYHYTKVQKNDPQLMIMPDNSLFSRNDYRFRNSIIREGETEEIVRALKYVKEVLDTYKTVRVEEPMSALKL